MKTLSFKGSLSLADLQTTLRETENMEFIRLVHMEIEGDDNLGAFADVDPAADAPGDLELVADVLDVNAEVAARLQQGQHLIFNEKLNIEGDETAVLAFR